MKWETQNIRYSMVSTLAVFLIANCSTGTPDVKPEVGTKRESGTSMTVKIDSVHSYENFVNDAKLHIGCNEVITGPSENDPDVYYLCGKGDYNVVKYMISKEVSNESIRRVDFSWCDFHKDVGQGLHTGRKEAKEMLKYMVNAYGIDKRVSNDFFEEKNMVYKTRKWAIDLEIEKGPGAYSRAVILHPINAP